MASDNLKEKYPCLMLQWNWEKNILLNPEEVGPQSHRKVWWRCEKGHEWEATIASRVSGCGCPVCANRMILPGTNDLATTHPELVVEWHPTKNGDLTPQKVGAGYRKKVWWICEKGHEWQSAVHTRVQQVSGCPVCANYIVQTGYNDLATLFPAVAAQWHPTRNGNLKPEEIVAGSNRSVWWQCSFGHAWRATVVDRTRGTTSCPYCTNRKVLEGFNDLATVCPEVAAQWHPTLNGELTPQQVTAGSSRRIWWICAEGHVWRTAVYNRAGRDKRTGCPVCMGNCRLKRQ